MSDTQTLKVFLSWSGARSRAVANALREWLPLLFDNVRPFMSESDIEAGQRGLHEIETELAGTTFGIIVVTPENQQRPWINFEAGALSKVVDGSSDNRVVPLLVGMSRPTELVGPLIQFQAKMFDHGGIRDLTRAIGGAVGVEQHTVDARVDAYWQRLEERARPGLETEPATEADRRTAEDVLDEILENTRALRREITALEEQGKSPEPLNSGGLKRVMKLAMEMDYEVQNVSTNNDGIAYVFVTDDFGAPPLQQDETFAAEAAERFDLKAQIVRVRSRRGPRASS